MSWQPISRFALALAIVLGLSVPAWAQFTLVGQDYQDCGTTAATCVFDAAVTAASGDLIVVLFSNRDIVDVSSVSDAVNGSGYTCPDELDHTQSGTFRGMGCYLINSGAGSIAPTITWASSSRGYGNVQVWRPTGTVTLDATAEGGQDSGTAHSLGTLNTGANAAIVLCGYGVGSAGTYTEGTGYTKLTDGASRWMGQYDITSVASGSFTCAMTTSVSMLSAGVAVSFNDSGGGGGGGPCTLALLGAGKCDE